MEPPGRPRVLFLCTGNSCRSQMAEGLLRHFAGDRFEVHSAGTRPVGLNPGAVASMARIGIDIAAHTSKAIDAYLGDPPELVITVCDDARETCPILPGATHKVHWPFPDPADARGSEAEVAAVFDSVRDAIRARISAWLEQGAKLTALGT